MPRPCRPLVFLLLMVLAGLSSALAQQPAQAVLLVATQQSQGDPNFAESVVLVTRHGKSRPLGVILNRPLPAAEANPGTEGDKQAVKRSLFFGGPVAPRSLIYVFRGEVDSSGRRDLLSLGNGMFLGIGRGVLDPAVANKPADALKVFAGFASWGHGQLENEIAAGGWLLLPFDPEVVFRTDTRDMWRELHARASARRL